MKILKTLQLFIMPALLVCSDTGSTVYAQEKNKWRVTQEEVQAVQDFFTTVDQKTGRVTETAPAGRKDDSKGVLKTNMKRDRKSFLMNGNKIQVELTDYGGIGTGYGGIREISNVIWKSLPYVYQFVPIVGASVPDDKNPNKKLHIISDALNDYESYNLIEINLTKDTLWQFQPIPGYCDPNQNNMAHNPDFDRDKDGKPDSWARNWYNETLGKYVWPGYLKQDANNADLEVFWAMDDRDNMEFNYYPYADRTKKGIGIQIDGRAFQWSNSLAENAVFFVYTITNVSDKDLDTVFFGIYGDPDIGGQTDNSDDKGYFIPPYSIPGYNVDNIPVSARSMVYFNDDGNREGAYGLPIGVLGCKFLESPGNANDQKDNDGDGMIDESQSDNIDNDKDWNSETDDVGIDGIAGTFDEGEKDGLPTRGRVMENGSIDPLHPGEPNYEYTDLDESDQIGLTSFSNWIWRTTGVNNDEDIWTRNLPGSFGQFEKKGADITFTFGSGYISLKKGESKRISMALLLGDDLSDLLTTAKTVQGIYDKNYNFFRPPDLPTLTATPGDRKVTLSWDSKAESSVDPITGKDFEGYVIYRSTDPGFADQQTVTDGKGTGFLLEPLKTLNGNECKWDIDKYDEPYTDENGNGRYDYREKFTDINKDGVWTSGLEDTWKGYHPVDYQGRGLHYYLGDNSGLVHTYTDSNNVINGQTYYYALVAYDHGDLTSFPPTETTKKISYNPITSEISFDQNTVQVIPGPRAGGYSDPVIESDKVLHTSGISNARIETIVLNDLAISDNTYRLTISDSMMYNKKMIAQKNYTLFDQKVYQQKVKFFGTKYSELGIRNIIDDEYLKLTDGNGKVFKNPTDFILDIATGKIKRTDNSSIPDNSDIEYTMSYRYNPVSASTSFSGKDDNPAFDGIKLKLTDNPVLEVDETKTKWLKHKTNLSYTIALATPGTTSIKEKWGSDYEIEFSDNVIDSAYTKLPGKPKTKIPVKFTVRDVTTGIPQKIYTYLYQSDPKTQNNQWDPGEEIVLYKPGYTGAKDSDKLTWGVKLAYTPNVKDTVLPGSGDILFISTKRPFTSRDTFYIKTTAGKVTAEKAKSALDNIYVVPNPYVGYNEMEPVNKLTGQSRGERRIYFENLPPVCKIRIFTVAGDPVQEINHDSPFENGREYWNLLNRDGFSVAYGLYIAHIDAPGVGEKIVKFALIK